jgi:nucleoside-diphosphate-sugar epimerase
MRIFITGIKSFLGRALAQYLREQGAFVSGSVSAKEGLDRRLGATEVIVLGDSPRSDIFTDVDLVIHCAFDLSAQGSVHNVSGTQQIADAARAAGVSQQIFVSSLSAREDADSSYGREKFEAEKIFVHHGDTIVRPGLIIGDAGLFGRTVRLVRRVPIVPLFDGGSALVYYIGLEDLARAIGTLAKASSSPARTYTLIAEQPATQRELMREIARAQGLIRIFIPIPSALVIRILQVAERCHIALPVQSQNVIGLIKNGKLHYRSDVTALIGEAKTLRQILTP